MIESLNLVKQVFSEKMEDVLAHIMEDETFTESQETSLLNEFLEMEKEMIKKLDSAIENWELEEAKKKLRF